MNIPKENVEGVMRRLEKLLAISKDHRADANEAAAAAAMAAKLMLKYQISEADAIISRLVKGEDMGQDGFVATFRRDGTPVKQVPQWASIIGLAVARLTGTRASLSRNPKGEAVVLFMGYIPDVKTAISAMSYLQTSMDNLRRDFMETYTYKNVGVTSLNSYTKGLSNGVAAMLEENMKSNQTEMAEELKIGSQGNALVVAKSAAIDEKFGEQKTKSMTSAVTDEDSALKGYADGKNIKIRAAVESSVAPVALITG